MQSFLKFKLKFKFKFRSWKTLAINYKFKFVQFSAHDSTNIKINNCEIGERVLRLTEVEIWEQINKITLSLTNSCHLNCSDRIVVDNYNSHTAVRTVVVVEEADIVVVVEEVGSLHNQRGNYLWQYHVSISFNTLNNSRIVNNLNLIFELTLIWRSMASASSTRPICR
mgnify:CR=1 FL=1